MTICVDPPTPVTAPVFFHLLNARFTYSILLCFSLPSLPLSLFECPLLSLLPTAGAPEASGFQLTAATNECHRSGTSASQWLVVWWTWPLYAVL